MDKKTNSIDIWVAVNKDNNIRMFLDEPVRNTATGKWESKHPYVNSVLQKEFEELVQKSNITWEADANLFSIAIQ